ncbi:DsbA family oxidoreductase [Actinacidiphila oryziradicis]|uniref:DsbA family oxidoreductase n=1 Tax=Actinacidiphila oryziradicis TaxID=2571141 RepID=A0A4U0SKC6_9ACTN|nr:DsbA family oxidoreductase [Actinacidiphila oryziradicis]TKA08541.1 DsbA family oxidoreductase [Actinacidiphila oryziradicis]
MKVEIYSDIACPWCYVGKRRFERALAAFPQADSVEVVYRPYQLVPDKSEQPEPHRQYLTQRFGPQAEAMDARLVELGRVEGLPFDLDRAIENNTLLAHRLLWHALTVYGPKVQGALKDRLLTAHFAEGADIGDRHTLADLAAQAGVDRDGAAAFLASDDGREEVLAEIDEARQLGITAVPTFVFEGQWAVQGGQESSTFLSVLEQVAKGTGATVSAAPAGDTCADGACEVPAP